MGELTNFIFKLDGTKYPAPRDWADITIDAVFDNNGDQPAISSEGFTFVNDAAVFVRDYIEQGKTGGRGIFEGAKFELSINSSQDNVEAFVGSLDFVSEYFQINPAEVRCRIKKEDGADNFNDRAAAITAGLLQSEGLLKPNDFVPVSYVVEKEINLLEIINITIALYLMIKEIIEAINRIVDSIREIVAAAIPVGLPIPSPDAGKIIKAIIKVLIDIVVTILLSIAITEMMQGLIELFISKVRVQLGINFKAYLEKIAEKLGYTLETSIPELDFYTFLPSKPSEDETSTGIPRPDDFGYTGSEFIRLVLDMFNARAKPIGNVLHIRPDKDPWWVKTSTYKLTETIEYEEQRRYNTDEMRATRLIQFRTDSSDSWTIENFKGTVYEVVTEPITVVNPKNVRLFGLDEDAMPIALGNRKTELNDLELALKPLASVADGIINAFGGNGNLEKRIDQRVGMLKLSQRSFGVSKVLATAGNRMRTDHREVLSAKYLYDNYHFTRSFIANNFKAQKVRFENIRIPFGLSDLIKLIDNSYFVTSDGRTGKFLTLKHELAADVAIASFEIEEIYTKNLKETTIEPS
jgi:hypothetical protein